MRQLARHYAYVLPGLPIALFSLSLLLSLTAASIVTSVIWLGALLMPITLLLASGFAELSRNRLRLWGAAVEPVRYRPTGPGPLGLLRVLLDPRRWLDLVFETLISFPLRLVTFLVTLVWTVGAAAGLTYFFWSLFLPEERSVIRLLHLAGSGLVPQSPVAQYLIDAGAHFLLGAALALSLPTVLRAAAGLDGLLTTALLGDGGRGELFGHRLTRPGTSGAPGSDAESEASTASFSARAWAWIGSVFAAVVLLAVAWPLTAALYSVPVALAMVLVLAHSAAVVLTLRWVWPGLALSVGASAGIMLMTADSGVVVWPWPVTALITQCAVLAVAALTRPWYCAASGWCAGALLTLAALLLSLPEMPDGALATGIVTASVSAAVVIVGTLARMWILNAGRLEAAERTSAEQDRRRKELEERNRIARELHDVVAHSMSVISVQAATARYRNPGIDAAAQREFEEIASSSREALSEMRMLLSVLRAEDDAPTAPEPGLVQIDSLVESTRASGTDIRYTGLREPVPAVNPAAGLAAYRAVQEALSNALRHAPGAAVDVEVALERPHRLRVEVINEAPPRPPKEPAPGAGLGLSGIRERIGAVGGTVELSPTPQGGFAMRATLPL